MKKIQRIIQNKNTFSILFILSFVIVFVTFIYNDILYTASHTINYIDAIFKGDIFSLYKVNYNFVMNGIETAVTYDFPIFTAFIPWCLPLVILKKIININITTNFFALMWIKFLPLFFTILSAWILKKICNEIKINKKYIKWVLLIFLSSPLVFSSVYYMAQYDIITIFFMLLGIYSYLKEDYKKFIMWFAIAIPLKLFPLFVFIPLLLLKQKRISKIFVSGLSSCSILIAAKIIEKFLPYYSQSAGTFTSGMVSRILNDFSLKIGVGEVSIFIVVYILICAYCYLKSSNIEKIQLYKYTIYIPFAVFSILFMFILSHPYWMIYLTPFFAVMLFQNTKYFKFNILIETIMSIFILLSQILVFFWCFSVKQIEYMFLYYLFPKDISNISTYYLSEKLPLNNYLPLILAIYMATNILLLIINHPKNQKEENVKIEDNLLILIFRMLIFLFIALLLIFCYIK